MSPRIVLATAVVAALAVAAVVWHTQQPGHSVTQIQVGQRHRSATGALHARFVVEIAVTGAGGRRPIPRAGVSLVNARTGRQYFARTDRGGRLDILLAPGRYTVTLDAGPHWTVAVPSGRTTVRQFAEQTA